MRTLLLMVLLGVVGAPRQQGAAPASGAPPTPRTQAAPAAQFEAAYRRFCDTRRAFRESVDPRSIGGRGLVTTDDAAGGDDFLSTPDRELWRGNLERFVLVTRDESVAVAFASLVVPPERPDSSPKILQAVVVLTNVDGQWRVAREACIDAKSVELLYTLVAPTPQPPPAGVRPAYHEHVKARHAKRVSLMVTDGSYISHGPGWSGDRFNRGLTVLPMVEDRIHAHWSATVDEFQLLSHTDDTAIARARVKGSWDLKFNEPGFADIVTTADQRDFVVLLQRTGVNRWQVVEEIQFR